MKLDGEPLGPESLDIAVDRLAGAVLQVGKRQFRRIVVGCETTRRGRYTGRRRKACSRPKALRSSMVP